MSSKVLSRSINTVSLPSTVSSDHRNRLDVQNGATSVPTSGKINSGVILQDYLIVEEDEKDTIRKQVSKNRKVTIFYHDKLVDPKGVPYNNSMVRTFMLAGESLTSSKSTKSGRKSKGSKLPSHGAKVYGNENLPKISRHLNPLKNYLYSQFIANSTIAGSTVGSYGTISHTLGQLDGVSSYTSLYDQYCIKRIEMWFEARNTEVTGGNGTQPSLWVSYDPDGSTITSVSDLRQYEDVVQCLGTQSMYLCYTPSVAIATYGGAFTKYSFEMNQWCDVANTDIIHYSCVYALDPVATNGDYTYTVCSRIWVEFRGVR